MMRVLLDTNILLDSLLARTPFDIEADKIWQAHDDERFIGFITATTLTTIFYTAERTTNSLAKAHEAISLCLEAFEICPVGRSALVEAAKLAGDFEDNLQAVCAKRARLDAIVTRDKGFKAKGILILAPADFIKRLKL